MDLLSISKSNFIKHMKTSEVLPNYLIFLFLSIIVSNFNPTSTNLSLTNICIIYTNFCKAYQTNQCQSPLTMTQTPWRSSGL